MSSVSRLWQISKTDPKRSSQLTRKEKCCLSWGEWPLCPCPAAEVWMNDDLPVATPHSRSSWNCNIWYVKPFPSSPMRFLQGTLTSSKKIWAVSDDLIPSLSIFLATWMPEEKGIWERSQKLESLWTSTMFRKKNLQMWMYLPRQEWNLSLGKT